VRAYKQRGYSAIDGRTYAGREAKLWREAAIRLKGGASCPFHLKLEINSAAFDLWLMLELAEESAQNAKRRGSVLNRRYKTLPKLRDQFDKVSARFERRREALQLEKGDSISRGGS